MLGIRIENGTLQDFEPGGLCQAAFLAAPDAFTEITASRAVAPGEGPP
jgi:hypothetical protein